MLELLVRLVPAYYTLAEQVRSYVGLKHGAIYLNHMIRNACIRTNIVARQFAAYVTLVAEQFLSCMLLQQQKIAVISGCKHYPCRAPRSSEYF